MLNTYEKLLIIFIACILIFALTCCSQQIVTETQCLNSFGVKNSDKEEEHGGDVKISGLVSCKWECKVAPNCITYLTFKEDGTYREDNCELNYFFEGKYYTSKDTIFLIEYDLASNLPNETRIVNTAIYTYICQKDSLRFVSNKTIANGKVVRTYFSDTPIYFVQER